MAALSAAFGRAYNVVQQTIESLEIPISSFEIDGIFLRLDYLTRTLVNLDSSSSPTDEIVGLLGETMSYLRGIDTESSASAIEFAPKTFSGHCGRLSFEIKEEQLSYLIDQSFQVPIIAQLFRVSPRTIESRMAKYGLSISGTMTTVLPSVYYIMYQSISY